MEYHILVYPPESGKTGHVYRRLECAQADQRDRYPDTKLLTVVETPFIRVIETKEITA
jgi:hypothetical protein